MEYAVIGLGRFGMSLAVELQKLGRDVVAIDSNHHICERASEVIENVLCLDATDPKALRQIDIERFDVVVVGIGQDDMTASFLTCLTLLECGVKEIIAKASTDEQRKILQLIGVSDIIMPETDMGRKLAKTLSRQYKLDCFDFEEGIRADTVEVNPHMKLLVNRTIDKINLRKKYNINIISIKRGDMIIVPDGQTEILIGDKILIIGNEDKLEEFENTLVKEKRGLF